MRFYGLFLHFHRFGFVWQDEVQKNTGNCRQTDSSQREVPGLKIRFTENFLLFGVTKNTEQASYKKIEQY